MTPQERKEAIENHPVYEIYGGEHQPIKIEKEEYKTTCCSKSLSREAFHFLENKMWERIYKKFHEERYGDKLFRLEDEIGKPYADLGIIQGTEESEKGRIPMLNGKLVPDLGCPDRYALLEIKNCRRVRWSHGENIWQAVLQQHEYEPYLKLQKETGHIIFIVWILQSNHPPLDSILRGSPVECTIEPGVYIKTLDFLVPRIVKQHTIIPHVFLKQESEYVLWDWSCFGSPNIPIKEFPG